MKPTTTTEKKENSELTNFESYKKNKNLYSLVF